jgi:TPP-dependent pyruvate/acetoin dehydrogenase alpha subunit
MLNISNFESTELMLKLWKNMYRIRAVEEMIAERYSEGRMRCPTHLSIGQEAVPSAMAENIRSSDFAVSTHRGHAHYLAKGGSLNAMISELYGKATGCCGGRGGSMHLADTSVGFMGTTAIVGNSIPLGVGLALSAQLRGTNQISCVYLGDGAIEEGVFYESVNFAVVRKLPVLFVCENNLYSVYSPLAIRQPQERKIFKMVEAMGIRVNSCDGNDALASCKVIAEAVRFVRGGEGPYFLEFSTYRWREHCGPDYDNHLNYRSPDEVAMWMERDPVARAEMFLLKADPRLTDVLSKFKISVVQEVDRAFEFAEDSSFPDPMFVGAGVYA